MSLRGKAAIVGAALAVIVCGWLLRDAAAVREKEVQES